MKYCKSWNTGDKLSLNFARLIRQSYSPQAPDYITT